MDGVMDIISNVASNVPYAENAGDYVVDGLLYCGKCHTKKQTKGTVMGNDIVVPCVCDCKMRELEATRLEAEQQKRRMAIERYRSMGFDYKEMCNWTFANDDGKSPKQKKAMQNYVKNFADFYHKGKGLMLYGDVGTGKSYYAACIVNELLEQGHTCLMTNFAKISNIKWENKQEYIDSLNKFDLLVIDDFGTERTTEYAQELLYTIIDNRYRAKKPLIITTNFNASQMAKTENMTEKRIFDRVLSMCHPYEISGGSRRKMKLMAEYNDINKILES